MSRKRKVLTLEERVDVIRKLLSRAKSEWGKRRYRVLLETEKTY